MKGTNTLIVSHEQMCEIVQEWLKYKFADDKVTEVDVKGYGKQFTITLEEKKDE